MEVLFILKHFSSCYETKSSCCFFFFNHSLQRKRLYRQHHAKKCVLLPAGRCCYFFSFCMADIADAMGSGKTKEEFRAVLKDSRIGSFGVLALIFYFLFAAALLSQLLEINAKINNSYIFLIIASTLCFNASLIILCTSFSFLFTYPLYTITQKEKGYNGDFLGANCLLWELAGYFSLVLFYQL